LALYDFQDVGDHFKHPHGWWTWSRQCQGGSCLRSQTDYVMAQNVSHFRHWVIKIPRFDTDHHASMAEITFGKLYIHCNYLDSQCSLPRFPFQRPFSKNDTHFQHLKENRNLRILNDKETNRGSHYQHVVPQSLWPYNPLIFRYMMSQLNIQSPPILEDFRFATFCHKTHLIHMTTSEESLRVLFFTHSLAVDLVH
jgi:hypothetical protein